MKYTITTTEKDAVKIRGSIDKIPGWEAKCGNNIAAAHSEWLAIRKVMNMMFNLERMEQDENDSDIDKGTGDKSSGSIS